MEVQQQAMGRWIRTPPTTARFPDYSAGGPIFVNRQDDPAVGREILRLIAGASRSIALVSPLASDQLVGQALIDARHRGVRVRFITELRDNREKGISYPTRGFRSTDKKPLNDHFEAIRKLARHLVFCGGLAYCAHAKLLSVDEQVILISSANLTANSLGWGEHPSIEVGIRLDSKTAVTAWAHTIKSLWASCPFRFHVLGEDVSLQEVGTPRIDYDVLTRELSAGCRMAWTYPPSRYGIRDALVKLCGSATQRIILCAMSFYETDQIPLLHRALLVALDRGVRVTVVVRPEHFGPEQYPDASTKVLLGQGLELCGYSGLHAKGVMVDGDTVAILSANFNPYSLECSEDSAQVECGMVCQSACPHPLSGFGKILEWIAEHPTHRYVWD